MDIFGILLFLLALTFAGISGKHFAYEKRVKGWIALVVAMILGILSTVIITSIPEKPKEYPSDKYEMKIKTTTIEGITDTTYVITRKEHYENY